MEHTDDFAFHPSAVFSKTANEFLSPRTLYPPLVLNMTDAGKDRLIGYKSFIIRILLRYEKSPCYF